MAQTFGGIRRSHTMPALRASSGSPAAVKEEKRELLKALKKREMLLTLLAEQKRGMKMAESAPGKFFMDRGSALPRSPILGALKLKKMRRRQIAVEEAKGGVRASRRRSNSLHKDLAMMKAVKLASHAGIWHAAKANSKDVSFILDNRVQPKQLPSAKYTPFPGTFSEGNNSGLFPLPDQGQESVYSESARGDWRNAFVTPRMPTPYGTRYRKSKFVLQSARKREPVKGHYRSPEKYPEGRITRILGPTVPIWKSAMERKTKKMTIDEWNDFCLDSFYLEAAGGSGGDLGRGKRDTQELADILTTKGFRYGEILRNAKLEQNDREDEMTIHGVTRGDTKRRR